MSIKMKSGESDVKQPPSFKCDWCSKPFRYPSQLKEHIRVHTREKPYPCKFCNKSFSHSSALTQHERIHTGDKPFNCRWCNKAFSQSSNLKRHERVHKDHENLPMSAGRANASVGSGRGKHKNMTPFTEVPEVLETSSNPPKVTNVAGAKKSGPRVVKQNLAAKMASVAPRRGIKHVASPLSMGETGEVQCNPIKFPLEVVQNYQHLNVATTQPDSSKKIFRGRLFDADSKVNQLERNEDHDGSTIVETDIDLDENVDPSETRIIQNRQAALGKSIDEYLSCGQNSASPYQDDVSQFFLSKFAWSPSSLLNSPRKSPSHSPVILRSSPLSIPPENTGGFYFRTKVESPIAFGSATKNSRSMSLRF